MTIEDHSICENLYVVGLGDTNMALGVECLQSLEEFS